MRTQMMKGLLVVSAAMILSGPALAEGKDGYSHHHKGEWHEKMKNMTPEERKAFMEERKAKWEALSTEEKVKMIEEKRAERLKEKEAQWEKMSDEEKVKYVEEKMKRKHDYHKKHRRDKGAETNGAE